MNPPAVGPGRGWVPPPPPRRRTGRLLVLTLVGLLGLTGAGLVAGVARAEYGRDFSRRPSAQQLFDADVRAALVARTTALRTRDEKAFLSGFDPGRPALIAQERRLFGNLIQLPLVSSTFTDGLGPTGGATVNVPTDGGPPDGSRPIPVVLALQIRGVDPVPQQVVHQESWVRRGGRLVVTASLPLGADHQSDSHGPIESESLTVVNGPLVTVAATHDVTGVASISAAAERSARLVHAMWGSRPGPSRFLVFVSGLQPAVPTWYDATLGSRPSGFTVPQLAPATDSDSDRHWDGSRVVLDLTTTHRADVGQVLRHEFTHAVTLPVKAIPNGVADPYPIWAEEGFAAWSEELDVPLARTRRWQDLAYLAALGRWDHRLPPASTTAFYSGAPSEDLHYAEAAMVFRYVATRWGEGRAIDLYVRIASGAPDAIRTTLGLSDAALQQAWATWVDVELARLR